MKVEVWNTVDADGDVVCITVFPSSITEHERSQALQDGEGEHTKVREIEGATWEECMKEHHRLMGWQPYVPISERSHR